MGKHKQKALIIGASRGLGLALAKEYLKRGWSVVATERSAAKSGLSQLKGEFKEDLQIESVDIAEQTQIVALKSKLKGSMFDLLFVNAGIADGAHEKIGDITNETFFKIMLTNTLSPMRVIESLESLIPQTGTIGVMSSGLASITDNTSGGWEVYRGSKAALNTLMRSYVARRDQDKRTYLAIAPGWVQTDMGGSEALLTIEQSIPRVVDVIDSQTGKGGLQFLNYDGRTLAW